MKPRRRLALVAVPLLVIALAACGGVQTAACSLFGYAVEIQADLNELLALDPALVAQSGTPENAAALDAIDGLDATRAEGQDALDSAADDVGPVIERAFQAALDATEIGAANLRTAVESGDPAAVTEAMGDVQLAANAIDTFMTALGDSRFECDEAASPSATEGSSASAPASASASASASAPPSDTPHRLADRDGVPDSGADADSNAEPHPDSNAESDAITHAESDAEPHADRRRRRRADAEPHAIADREPRRAPRRRRRPLRARRQPRARRHRLHRPRPRAHRRSPRHRRAANPAIRGPGRCRGSSAWCSSRWPAERSTSGTRTGKRRPTPPT